jgi:arginase
MPRPVSEDGPTALRRLGLVEALENYFEVTDLGDLQVPRPQTGAGPGPLLEQVLATAEVQAGTFTSSYTADCLPITLGGDHTTSLGTALALTQLGLSFDVVWLDAHGDFNTPFTSASGNPHGMVLALLAGLTPYLRQTVPHWRLHLWGVRDLDHGERQLLEALGVQVRDVAAVRAGWPELLKSLGPNVLVSFDCDCCAPEVAPGTMTPVPGGFGRAEALRLVQEVGKRRRVLALDVVEFHPDRDCHDRTARLACDVATTVAAAQARQRSARPPARVRRRASATRRCG